MIFHEGDPAGALHLIDAGHVAIRLTTVLGDVAIVDVLQNGESFGERVLVHGDGERSATAVAMSAVETLTLDPASFERLSEGARIAGAAVGIQAMKAVEIGDGWDNARLRGSAVHDELRYADGYKRDTNRAGGLEGGMTNGEPVIVRIAMKPLPTLMKPLKTATLDTHEPAEALVERSDTTAIYAAAVVAEAVIAFELARAAHEKCGGDAIGDFIAAHAHYLDRIPWSPA